jgi:hypothetical protein
MYSGVSHTGACCASEAGFRLKLHLHDPAFLVASKTTTPSPVKRLVSGAWEPEMGAFRRVSTSRLGNCIGVWEHPADALAGYCRRL